MGWLEALVLGIVQGLTEFLPISSSAHQSIVGQVFGGQDPGSAFTAITQLGTESAVIIYFRKDIWLIIKSWTLALIGKLPRDDPEARLGWLVIIGSVPIVVLGLVFQDAIDHRPAEPLDDCRDARRLRHHHRSDRPGRAERAAAGVHDLAARHLSRAGAVARLDPGRFPIRCDHRRRAGARLPAGGGRQVLIPAGHTSSGWLRLFQAG